MFDSLGKFTRKFTPIDGGSLYYPSRKAGGKFVTVEEYEALVSDWTRVAGRAGTWKSVGLIAVALLFWTLVSQLLALPKWADQITIYACAGALVGWVLWTSLAPRRLVKGRPDFAPPRPVSESKREARAALNWPFVLVVLLITGAVFFGRVTSPERTWAWWAWVIGSGGVFGGYLWIAVQKVRDQKR